MIRKLATLILVFFSMLFLAQDVEAKTLPQSKTATKTTVAKSVNKTNITVSPYLRRDRKALIISFSNLQNAKSVSYELTYQTSEQQEGAMGSLNLKGVTKTSTELLFGTCSKNICRYHKGISNMSLRVTYTSNNGKTYVQKFRIKI